MEIRKLDDELMTENELDKLSVEDIIRYIIEYSGYNDIIYIVNLQLK